MPNTTDCEFETNICDLLRMYHSENSGLKFFRKAMNVNPLWYKFFGTFLLIIGILCVVFHVMIFAFFAKAIRRNLARKLNVYIVSLIISDLGMFSSNFPTMLYSCFRGGWIYGVSDNAVSISKRISISIRVTFLSHFGTLLKITALIVCKVVACLGGWFSFAQIGTLVAIVNQRYDAIVLMKSSSVLKQCCNIAIIWFLSLLLAVMPVFGIGAYAPDGILISCSFNYIEMEPTNFVYIMTMVIFGYAVPLIRLCYCYIIIIQTVQKSGKAVQTLSGTSSFFRRHLNKRNKNLFTAAFKSVVCFIVSWTPFAVLALVSFVGDSVHPIAITFAFVLAKSSTVMNAVLYVMNHPDFKMKISVPTRASSQGLTYSAQSLTSRMTGFRSNVNGRETTTI